MWCKEQSNSCLNPLAAAARDLHLENFQQQMNKWWDNILDRTPPQCSCLGPVLTNAAAQSILDIAGPTLDLGETTEWSLGVLAHQLWATIMETSLTLINICIKKKRMSTEHSEHLQKVLLYKMEQSNWPLQLLLSVSS